MITYVCSARASATTGAALRVDGGVVRADRLSTAGPSQGANSAPTGGSAAAIAASMGVQG
jgi:hypothetical protein